MTSYVDRIFNRNKIVSDPLYAQEAAHGLFLWPEAREEHYHEATNYISNTLLHIWKTNECSFWDTYYGKTEREQTKAMILGEMIHTALLEPDAFDERYCFVRSTIVMSPQFKATAEHLAAIDKPVDDITDEEVIDAYKMFYCNNRNSKSEALKYWKDKGLKMAVQDIKEKGSRYALSASEYELAKTLQRAAMDNDIYRALMSNGEIYTEKELYWSTRVKNRPGLTDGGNMMCKAKIDRIKVVRENVYLIDMKTTTLDLGDWMNGARNRGYVRQLAFYRKALLENFEAELQGKKIWPYIALVHIPTKRVYTVCVSDSDINVASDWIENTLCEIYDSFTRNCTGNTRRYYLSTSGYDRVLPYAGDFYIGFDDPFNTAHSLHRKDIYGEND